MANTPSTTKTANADSRTIAGAIADPSTITARADAEAIVRARPRHCRGPHVQSVAFVIGQLQIAIERQRDLKARHLATPGNTEATLPTPTLGPDHDHAWFTDDARTALLAMPSTRHVQGAFLEESNRREQIAALVDAVARGAGCGYDVNAIVVTLPFDGARYIKESDKIDNRIACPKCQQPIAITAPLFPALVDDLTERLPLPTGTGATSGAGGAAA